MYTYHCPQCENPFHNASKNAKYCSRACYDKAQGARGTTMPCAGCGKPMRVSPSRATRFKGARHLTCSFTCQSKLADQPQPYSCQRCGTIVYRTSFQMKRRQRVFCSEECYRPTQTITCGHCGKEMRKPPSEISKVAISFCSQACHYAARTVPIEERFKQRFIVGKPNECWEWQAGRHTFGYGQIYGDGKLQNAHVVAYMLHHGLTEIPKGMVVRHLCSNPPCVNPIHLALGTPADNSQDMVDADRHARGMRNPTAKLTDDDVRGIRHLAASGKYFKDIADLFGVSKSVVQSIVNHRTWKHLLTEQDRDMADAHAAARRRHMVHTHLTKQDVISIRNLAGKLPYSEIAYRFKLTISGVSSIINKKTWKHIT